MNDEFYRFQVYRSMNSGELEYVVKYFDLSIIGSGNTIDEAIAEAQDNLEVYLEYCREEGIPIPKPSLQDDLDDYSGKITLRISKSMHKRIAEQAKKEGISINSLLNEGIITYITHKECLNDSRKEATREIVKLTAEKSFEIFNNVYRKSNAVYDYEVENKPNKKIPLYS